MNPRQTALCIAAIAALALAAALTLAQEGAKTPAGKFSEWFCRQLTSKGVKVTDAQRAALEDLHPLFLEAARSEHAVEWFWYSVNEGAPRKALSWEDASKLILEGKVFAVSQGHDLGVDLVDRAGVQYRTREPKIDDVAALIRKVDPEHVFISYETE